VTEPARRKGLELVVGERSATRLATPVRAVAEALESQFHVGELVLDGIECDVDLLGREVGITVDADVRPGLGDVRLGAAGG